MTKIQLAPMPRKLSSPPRKLGPLSRFDKGQTRRPRPTKMTKAPALLKGGGFAV
jgi:hypothetical protein